MVGGDGVHAGGRGGGGELPYMFRDEVEEGLEFGQSQILMAFLVLVCTHPVTTLS